MQPNHEHAFYAWLIIIGLVCLTVFIGALIDRFFLYRRLRRQPLAVHLSKPRSDTWK